MRNILRKVYFGIMSKHGGCINMIVITSKQKLLVMLMDFKRWLDLKYIKRTDKEINEFLENRIKEDII